MYNIIVLLLLMFCQNEEEMYVINYIPWDVESIQGVNCLSKLDNHPFARKINITNKGVIEKIDSLLSNAKIDSSFKVNPKKMQIRISVHKKGMEQIFCISRDFEVFMSNKKLDLNKKTASYFMNIILKHEPDYMEY